MLGLIELLGWQLGAIESVCVTILVGFAVDYQVHMANAFVETPKALRATAAAMWWRMQTSAAAGSAGGSDVVTVNVKGDAASSEDTDSTNSSGSEDFQVAHHLPKALERRLRVHHAFFSLGVR